jgi:hypothetical protein
LQQAFIGRLGRVGTLAALPTRYRAGVRILLRKADNVSELLVEADADSNQAVCLVGRNDDTRLITLRPGVRKRGGRERAKGEHVLLAVETVAETPKLAAIGLDEKVQSATVGKLIRLVLGGRVDDGKLGEGHAGTTSQVHISYPQLYPHFGEKS